jgi:hypothetical protein
MMKIIPKSFGELKKRKGIYCDKNTGKCIDTEREITWKSVYDAPVELIRKEFKEGYKRYPTEAELNDMVLEGRWWTNRPAKELKKLGL